MRALLVYPRFPKGFWSFDRTLELQGARSMMPPLALITVAAMLPADWELRLVDRNVETLTEAHWAWSDIVLLSAMLAQKTDLLDLIREGKRRGVKVAVGGPYATAIPEDMRQAGADFLVLDEGEITIPIFLDALREGRSGGEFRSQGERPELSQTPVPRFDLLDFDAYAEMAVQFSRGCPFRCEFCDIIVLYGRRPRTKSPAQMLTELDRLFELGWRKPVFVVDDNFIGNKRAALAFLHALRPWMESHRFPFTFNTEASVDLATAPDLLQAMTECGFGAVFLGIETPDTDSLITISKTQNTRASLEGAVSTIAKAGLRVMSGFIVGFDGERAGAGDRIVKFVDKTSIPVAMLSMLQALPGTALWDRLDQEGRLRTGDATGSQTSFVNFVPTRPAPELLREYGEAFWRLYDPIDYLERSYRHYRVLGNAPWRRHKRESTRRRSQSTWRAVRAASIVCWQQGVRRETRWRFWPYLFAMWLHNRHVVGSYLGICAQYEHFHDFREVVRDEIAANLARNPLPT